MNAINPNGPAVAEVIVIIGATGDLAQRKLIPAIYHLWNGGYLPKKLTVVGVSRREFPDDVYRDMMCEALKSFSRTAKSGQDSCDPFVGNLFYHPLRFDDRGDYAELAARAGSRSMLATSTHDTKRSEDVRARLAVLSEVPAAWEAAALAGEALGMRVVLLRTGLVVISAIYLLRGLVLFFPSAFQRPDLSETFLRWSSAIVLVFGLVYAIGTWRAWNSLSGEA